MSKARTTLRASVRRTYLVGLLGQGRAMTAAEVADNWNNVATRKVVDDGKPGILRRTTIDTIQRDLARLVDEGLLDRRRSKTKGREWGAGRMLMYAEFETKLHLRPGYCGICGVCHDVREMWPHSGL